MRRPWSGSWALPPPPALRILDAEDEQGGRRLGPDRRRRPTSPWSRYALFGGRRRRGGRRDGENVNAFVDLYSFRAWVLLSVFLLLNLLDAHFTLLYLQRGGEEANPVAVQLLAWGMEWFILVKAVGVGIGALLFCVLKNFPNARLGVLVVLLFYQVLLVYHLYLYVFSPLE